MIPVARRCRTTLRDRHIEEPRASSHVLSRYFLLVYKVGYALIYKSTCLVLILVNFYIPYEKSGFREENTWVVGLIALVLNLSSWVLYLASYRIGRLGEQVLSCGRMLIILLAVLVFFTDMIAYYSPVGFSLWLPLAEATVRRGTLYLPGWWSVCVVLLALEGAYFRAVSQPFAS